MSRWFCRSPAGFSPSNATDAASSLFTTSGEMRMTFPGYVRPLNEISAGVPTDASFAYSSGSAICSSSDERLTTLSTA